MRLRRRDVLAALAAAGVSAAGCSGDGGTDAGEALADHEIETLVAVGETVYPSAAENVEGFVRDYADGRYEVGGDRARGVAEAVAALDDYVSEWYDGPYASLSADERADVLDYMTVDTADPDPDGVASERVRYYLVNELLYAFYASPTGAELAGLENPPGHPGGAASYRRGPTP